MLLPSQPSNQARTRSKRRPGLVIGSTTWSRCRWVARARIQHIINNNGGTVNSGTTVQDLTTGPVARRFAAIGESAGVASRGSAVAHTLLVSSAERSRATVPAIELTCPGRCDNPSRHEGRPFGPWKCIGTAPSRFRRAAVPLSLAPKFLSLATLLPVFSHPVDLNRSDTEVTELWKRVPGANFGSSVRKSGGCPEICLGVGSERCEVAPWAGWFTRIRSPVPANRSTMPVSSGERGAQGVGPMSLVASAARVALKVCRSVRSN